MMEAEKDVDNGNFIRDGQMPVMWHQTLLTLVQFYRPYLNEASIFKLKALVKVQFHSVVTPEIRKFLAQTKQQVAEQLARQQAEAAKLREQQQEAADKSDSDDESMESDD